jgi:hypothetical protein
MLNISNTFNCIAQLIAHRNLLNSNETVLAKQLGTRSEPNITVTRKAKAELVDFVLKTLRCVIAQEQRQYGAVPSLMQFCRVDVGLIRTEGGYLNYFVNEIERGINVGLWTGAFPEKVGLVAEKFSAVLHSWIIEQNRLSHQLFLG